MSALLEVQPAPGRESPEAIEAEARSIARHLIDQARR